MTILFTIW